jgi:hypothetical protein
MTEKRVKYKSPNGSVIIAQVDIVTVRMREEIIDFTLDDVGELDGTNYAGQKETIIDYLDTEFDCCLDEKGEQWQWDDLVPVPKKVVVVRNSENNDGFDLTVDGELVGAHISYKEFRELMRTRYRDRDVKVGE